MSNSIMKCCSHCKQEFPATTDYFNRNKSTIDGLFHWCKKCKAASDKKYRNTEQGKNTRNRNRKTEKAKNSQRIRSRRFAKTSKGHDHAIKSAKQARENHPERYRARKEVYKAIQRKEIPPAKMLLCQQCGAQARHYHHFKGYEPEHWFDIVPLCLVCHTKEHEIEADNE